nr:MAG TPA: hypothetical protein [Caudoviricetes sp.]
MWCTQQENIIYTLNYRLYFKYKYNFCCLSVVINYLVYPELLTSFLS